VRVEKQTRLRVPLHNIGGIVCFGRISASLMLLGKCADAGVAVALPPRAWMETLSWRWPADGRAW